MGDNRKELKLSQSKDWDAWLSVIRAKATGYEIWNIIDPARPIRSVGLTEPEEPDLDEMEGADFAEKHARYKIRMTKHKRALQEWKE